ncbi:Inositol hexakisphosphate and diphosphoinositol-pentakisphosphate kinase 2 [Blomia tropicalis]|nr:Inositol hexakisphosphate and diphosphoinositol-pentakisphosphate kinase 2 [Blomia tropicalis]
MSTKKRVKGYNYDKPSFYIEDDDSKSQSYDYDDDEQPPKQVVVGICSMSKKSESKPMKEILARLNEFEFIRTVVFPENVILNSPVDEWPEVDCLISFHSKGFPLSKAIEYATLREPFVINDLHMQYDIQDRRKVYKMLEEAGVELPRYVVLDRDSLTIEDRELIESEDHIEVNGVVFNKPFVEKPISAEDHNIYIYYPSSAGGGSQRLFRKIGSRSSVYSSESQVRKTGSYIYEEFMPTDGTDVKVYTVGPDYAHAEARKSPALDGKVERDKEGKEVRYPVMLSNAEKMIARNVCLAFNQTVCGFDLLRANGKSYVCDVNGFSFVKNSMKYYDDAARIMGNMILRNLAPQMHIPWLIPFQLDDPPIMPTTLGKMMELRCVTAIIRHGDRTPKQKMKMEVKHPRFFEIFEKYGGYKDNQHHVKLKKPTQLQEVLDIARYLLTEIDQNPDPEIEENRAKLEQLKSVLEMYGHFSGINRKVQLKYQPKGRPRRSSSEEDIPREPSLLCIVKWGGELTSRGRIQAEDMGRVFRCMYPGGQGDYAGNQGLGLLRLHSTFRHDLKIYASDEGRVQMTAAAFAKGLLALEGELTPILVQMVKSANTNGLLDNDCDSSKFQNTVKHKIHELMQIDRDFREEDIIKLNPMQAPSIQNAINFVKNPVKACERIHSYIQKLNSLIKVRRNEIHLQDSHLYYGETWDLMQRRWAKLEKDFKLKCGQFDISKIPDIYDCIKYDLQHNQHILQFTDSQDFYTYAKALADIVIPQEYGSDAHEKLTIGLGICTPLLKKIKVDLLSNMNESGQNDETESVNRLNPQYSHGVSSPGRHVRTRLYFTSESHIHSLLNVIRLGGLFDETKDEQWKRAMDYISAISELNYLTQIVIMLYEDQTKDAGSDDRFHVELHFSPGVSCCLQKNLPIGPGFRTQTARTAHSKKHFGTSKSVEKVLLSSSLPKPSSIKEEEIGDFSDISVDDDSESNSNSDVFHMHSCPRAMIHCKKNVFYSYASKNEASLCSSPESPTIVEEPESPPGFAQSSANKLETPKSEPIPITISACKERKISSNTKEDLILPTCAPTIITRSNSIATERAHSLESEKLDNLDHLKKPDNSIALSWTDVSGECSKPGCQVRQKGHRHSIPGQLLRLYNFADFHQFGSTTSLFSTAVISGSSSAPNLQDSIVDIPGAPTVRPLETLHNALSLKHLNMFLDKMITSSIFRLPVVSVTQSFLYSDPPSTMSNKTFCHLNLSQQSKLISNMSLISPDVSGDLDNWTHIIDGDPTSETQKTKLI